MQGQPAYCGDSQTQSDPDVARVMNVIICAAYWDWSEQEGAQWSQAREQGLKSRKRLYRSHSPAPVFTDGETEEGTQTSLLGGRAETMGGGPGQWW